MVQPIKRSNLRGGGGVERRLRDDSGKTEWGDGTKSEKQHGNGGHTNVGVSCCIFFFFKFSCLFIIAHLFPLTSDCCWTCKGTSTEVIWTFLQAYNPYPITSPLCYPLSPTPVRLFSTPQRSLITLSTPPGKAQVSRVHFPGIKTELSNYSLCMIVQFWSSIIFVQYPVEIRVTVSYSARIVHYQEI